MRLLENEYACMVLVITGMIVVALSVIVRSEGFWRMLRLWEAHM